jgi:hypothetical protein
VLVKQWQKIGEAGDIYPIVVPSDGIGIRKLKRFVVSAISIFAQDYERRRRNRPSNLLTGPERVLEKELAAAFTATSGNVVEQVYVSRSSTAYDGEVLVYDGIVDLVIENKSDVYFVELKNSGGGLYGGYRPSRVSMPWKDANRQIDRISKGTIELYKRGGVVLGVALMMIVLSEEDVRHNPLPSLSEILVYCDRYASNLTPNPNLAVAWALPSKLRYIPSRSHRYGMRFPAVLFCGKVHRLL